MKKLYGLIFTVCTIYFRIFSNFLRKNLLFIFFHKSGHFFSQVMWWNYDGSYGFRWFFSYVNVENHEYFYEIMCYQPLKQKLLLFSVQYYT